MVEDWWRFCNNLNHHKYISIRIIQSIYPHRVEGGGIKQQKNSGEKNLLATNIEYTNIIYDSSIK
jgi:hypothetical protein